MEIDSPNIVVGPELSVPITPEMQRDLDIKVGNKVAWLAVGKAYYLIRVRSIEELRGSLPPFDWSDYRDETDRDL